MKIKFQIIIFLSFFLLSFPDIKAQSDIDSNKIIKILTFNIYHGETMNHDFDIDKIADVINKVSPDFVALQEVDLKTNRIKKMDLATELACRTKMIPLFGKAMDFDGGEYGNAVLSKYSVFQSKSFILPSAPGYEPRNVLEIFSVLPTGDTIIFASTHLDYKKDDTIRILQARKLNKILHSNNYPMILAGDLNDVPGSRVIDFLENNWTSSYNKENTSFTFPSNAPVKKIDYVMFYPNSKFKVLERKVIKNKIASDHCAYLVILEVLKGL